MPRYLLHFLLNLPYLSLLFVVSSSYICIMDNHDAEVYVKALASRGYRMEVYKWEALTWPTERLIEITPMEAAALINHLSRVLAVKVPNIRFAGSFGGGMFYTGSKTVRVGISRDKKSVLFYVVVHEFSHYIADRFRRRSIGHSKPFKQALEKMYILANEWHRNYTYSSHDSL